jgi:hypothetical protein
MGRIEGEGRRIDPTAQERKHEQAPADGEPQSTSVQPQFTPPAPEAVRQATRLHALALRQSRVFSGNKNVGFLPLGKTSALVSCVTCFSQHAFFPQALSLFPTLPGENRVESACNYCPLRCLGNMPVSWAEQPLFFLRVPLTVLLSASHALRLQIGIRTPETIIVRHIPTIPLVMIARLTGGSNEPSPQTRLPPQSPQFCTDSEWTRQ